MSGLAWIILDAVLALTAIVGTIKVAITPPPKPLPAAQLEISEEKLKAADKPVREESQGGAAQTSSAHPDTLSPKASLDELWKETLFLPGRAEAEPGDAEAEAAAAAAALAGKNFEFELVGIAQISQSGKKASPVAILRSKQTNARNQQRQRGPGRGRDNSQNTKQTATAEPKVQEKLVFKEGDSINATGYLIKAIYPDQKMVEVSRGSETIKLTINFAGEEANQRRNAVTQAAAKKKETAAKEEQRQVSIREKQAKEAAQRQEDEQAKRNANPGTPPPPPGATNNNASGNAGQTSGRNATPNATTGDSQREQQMRERIRQRMNTNGAKPTEENNSNENSSQK